MRTAKETAVSGPGKTLGTIRSRPIDVKQLELTAPRKRTFVALELQPTHLPQRAHLKTGEELRPRRQRGRASQRNGVLNWPALK